MEPRPLVSDKEVDFLLRQARAPDSGAPPDLALLIELATPGTASAKVLSTIVDPNQVRVHAENFSRLAPPRFGPGPAEWSRYVDNILEAAKTEALRARDPKLTSVHLLAAVADTPASTAGAILAALGITSDSVRFAARTHELGKGATEPALAVAPLVRRTEATDHAPPHQRAADGLVRVVPIGLTVVGGDADLELIALEIRSSSSTLTWRAITRTYRYLDDIDLTVTDSSGRSYGCELVFMRGDAGSWRGEIVIVPNPSAASRLEVVVSALRARGASEIEPVLVGPWTFSFAT